MTSTAQYRRLLEDEEIKDRAELQLGDGNKQRAVQGTYCIYIYVLRTMYSVLCPLQTLLCNIQPEGEYSVH